MVGRPGLPRGRRPFEPVRSDVTSAIIARRPGSPQSAVPGRGGWSIRCRGGSARRLWTLDAPPFQPVEHQVQPDAELGVVVVGDLAHRGGDVRVAARPRSRRASPPPPAPCRRRRTAPALKPNTRLPSTCIAVWARCGDSPPASMRPGDAVHVAEGRAPGSSTAATGSAPRRPRVALTTSRRAPSACARSAPRQSARRPGNRRDLAHQHVQRPASTSSLFATWL